jgi:hypothetical protein
MLLYKDTAIFNSEKDFLFFTTENTEGKTELPETKKLFFTNFSHSKL